MEETILVPSPNWFQASGLGVSVDGWLAYGGPSKSLCVLEPLKSDDGIIGEDQRFKAHVVRSAHNEKIVSVDINPQWPEKRNIVTGSADGIIKEWCVENAGDKKCNIKYLHGHDAHQQEKEEVIGVSYSTNTVAISVGSFGHIVTWNLSTNVVRPYSSFLKGFKPMCMNCSPHIPMHVAVGTKQGVIFVVDLSGKPKILYKVRGQDDEVLRVVWCPQYEVTLKKTLVESKKRWSAMERMEKIRNEPEPQDTEIETPGTEKKLPEDSFDDTIGNTSIVPEDDMFDIYKDHEADEFGHKKYQPEDIYVKVKEETKEVDFLLECQKLKDDILKKKTESEQNIGDLVEAMDKVHVDAGEGPSKSEEEASQIETKDDLGSVHIHKHLLASVSKHGAIRIWSKSGKIVATCAIQCSYNKNANAKSKAPNWPTLCWYKPDALVIADGKNQILVCNPLQVDCKNKLEWKVVHALHKRGLFCIMTDAPRIQTSEMLSEPNCDDNWSIWTVAQDRNIIRYSLKLNKALAVWASCGSFLYEIKPCPYDAGKIAIGVGDGAVRVWESTTTDENETKISHGVVTTYWQNVQGKVLTVAWHPTKENLLAFSTAESRVGLIDTSGHSEKPAKTLVPALSNGVYSICWGQGMELYASGGGKLVVYQANKPTESPEVIDIEVEGEKWHTSAMVWNSCGLLVGSGTGGVALFTERGGQLLAATFVFSRMIHALEWHPQQTSSSHEESQYKNLIAVCSNDKCNTAVILQYRDKEGGGKELATFVKLIGHSNLVLHLAWNPHCDGQLLTTSFDGTVRMWDVVGGGVCVSIFGSHAGLSLGAAWCPRPALRGAALTGGGDCALRLWTVTDHPAELYEDTKPIFKKKKKLLKTKDESAKDQSEADKDDLPEYQDNLADVACSTIELRMRGSKRFLFPLLYRMMDKNNAITIINILQNYLKTNREIKSINDVLNSVPEGSDKSYLKIFGSTNDINELVDLELQCNLERGTVEAYIMILIFRGHIDDMIQFAIQREMLDPFLLSIAPCVSLKYWKEVAQSYAAQIDRIMARVDGDDEKVLRPTRFYGGVLLHKVAMALSVHDVKGAVEILKQAKLFKEAYLLCRLRHMDSIAEELLPVWAYECFKGGSLMVSAVCYIAMGNISKAAWVLGRSNDQDQLNLAAELAKVAGQNTFADHIEKKAKEKTDIEEALLDLPQRIELLLREKNIIPNNSNVETEVKNTEENESKEIEVKSTKSEEISDKNTSANGKEETENENTSVDDSKITEFKDVVNGNVETKAVNGNKE